MTTFIDIWRELFVAARFALVGLLATTVHILVVWVLLRQTELAPIPANTAAFLSAYGISFVGHYVWTFRSPGSARRAMWRFFIISGSAFLLNTLFLAGLVRGGWFSPVASAIFSASLVPIVSFFASQFWVFKRENGDTI